MTAVGVVQSLELGLIQYSSIAVRGVLVSAANCTAVASSIGLLNRRTYYSTTKLQQEVQESSDCDSEEKINVYKYIREHYTPYFGDGRFLEGPTKSTLHLWEKLQRLILEEQKRGVLDVDPKVPSTITAFGPGYISKANEKVVGLQCDSPLKRAIKPYGGWNMVKAALEAYGFKAEMSLQDVFTKHRKTHNQGCFDAYTRDMKLARSAGILSGLPDGYGRGRIIGDYRRVALYGVDYLIEQKKLEHQNLAETSTQETIRLREELSEQIRALQALKEMAATYGDDISKPATSAREAVQWLYYGYLGAVKQQDGAAMSLGRVDAFLDTYIEKDLQSGAITEEQAQELIDQFVMKLRIVRQLRTPDYNQLFAGDPTWVTAVLGGMTQDHRPLVTKTSFRLLQTFRNLGPAPEPNATILWDDNLPEGFRKFAAQISIESSCLQYENDAAMRNLFGSDYAIACCVSAMAIGKDMQFFGARCNLAKLMLYTLNQGRDEMSGKQVGPLSPPVQVNADGSINYDSLIERFQESMGWMAKLYADTMNVIHYMHDHHCYESLQMALHDAEVRRFMAFGISGLSVVADSLSAVKYAKVYPVRDQKTGLYTKFDIQGEYPAYGNDNEKADELAKWTVNTFSDLLQKQHTYRNSIPTLSVLTITSNVVYGKKTGDTPDGRHYPEAFAPGANPMHGRDMSGAIASLNSVAKLPYKKCLDGISNTFTLLPNTLGKDIGARVDNLVALLSGYFQNGGHHMNVNVLDRSMLEDAVEHPERYPNLTIRVSGYAVHFNKLTAEQKREVISRTFHESM